MTKSTTRIRLLMSATVIVAVIALFATGPRPLPAVAQTGASGVEELDYAIMGKIREEGLNRSQMMDHISWLTDVYGPRLTGSPAIKQASEWVQGKFEEWGLANIHEEEFEFGKGWSLVRFNANMVSPQVQPLIGYPHSWTSSTDGMVTADVVQVSIQSSDDFDEYRGKLGGKIVLTQPVREVRVLDGRLVLRMTEAVGARVCRSRFASFTSLKGSWPRSTGAATTPRRPAAAICPGRRSAPMAARCSPQAAARATRLPATSRPV